MQQSPKNSSHLQTAVIDITYRCNDVCAFCFNQRLINQAPELTLEQIKKDFRNSQQKFKLGHIILSGGEPTLHPQFFEIMDFFYNQTNISVSLNTNSLRFTDQKFVKQFEKILRKAKNQKKMFSLSLSNVDHFPAKTLKERLKLTGIKQALSLAWKTNCKTIVVYAVTKTNYRVLPQLAQMITAHKKRHIKLAPKLVHTVRGLYLDQYMNDAQKSATVPAKFSTIKPHLQKMFIELMRDKNGHVRVFNLPLCYFKDWQPLPNFVSYLDLPARKEHRTKISSEYLDLPPEPKPFQEKNWYVQECQKCCLEGVCGSIQPEFLEKYHYPKLTAF